MSHDHRSSPRLPRSRGDLPPLNAPPLSGAQPPVRPSGPVPPASHARFTPRPERPPARAPLPPVVRTTIPPLRLVDRVRFCIRARHFSPRTEKAYLAWIRRYAEFHGPRHPDVLGAPEVTSYLSHLATTRHVSASTQNQALSALVFLYRDVLGRELAGLDDAPARGSPQRLPRRAHPRGGPGGPAPPPAASPARWRPCMYGAGLRLLECCRLRVKDVDFTRRELTVRDGKGAQGPRHGAPRRRLVGRCAPISSACAAGTAPTSRGPPATSRCPTPSTASTRTPTASGRGSGSFPRARIYVDAATGERRRHHLHETRPPARVRARGAASPASPSRRAATPCATRSPPTCSRPATTSARSRSCSVTATSRTTMIYTHVLNRGGRGVRSPLDQLG